MPRVVITKTKDVKLPEQLSEPAGVRELETVRGGREILPITAGGEAETTLVELPIDRSIKPLTWGLHLDMKLTPEQSCAIRQVAAGLDKRQAKLGNGRRVVDASAAVRFMLEQIE